jgi:hypothetical protein
MVFSETCRLQWNQRCQQVLTEPAKPDRVFECGPVSKVLKASSVLEGPERSNKFFGAWQIMKDSKVSANTTRTFDVQIIDGRQKLFRRFAEPRSALDITMLTELAKLESIFGCSKALRDPKASPGTDGTCEAHRAFRSLVDFKGTRSIARYHRDL